ncbi:MAG: hypothetical protein SNF33_03390 [Candidatus Algichlamydia australiensis]|nr:hypothetical protein [Chlamydiales bacterium]
MSTATDNTPNGYNPVTPMSSIENQYSWLFDATVEEVPFQLIILGFMLLLMAYCDLQLNDTSQISGADSLMSNDITTIDDELTNAEGAVSINSDGDVSVNTDAFTQDDAQQLEQAYTSLFVSDPNSDYTWGQMNITWEGTTYYLWPNGTWSTEEFTDQSFEVNGHTVNQDGVINSDTNVSDAGLYMMTNGIYAVDMASYTGGTVDVNVTFTNENGYMTTESMYTNQIDPVMTSLDELFESFSKDGDTQVSMNESILYDYQNNDGDGSTLWDEMTGYGDGTWGFIYDYGNSLQNGGGSTLDGAVDAANGALTQVNNESTLLTNEIQKTTQEISNYNSVAQTILQDATKANMNSVSNQRV